MSSLVLLNDSLQGGDPQTIMFTQNGVQFTLTTAAPVGLFECFFGQLPPCSLASVDGPTTITINPPVSAIGFVFTMGEIGTATFTGTTGNEMVTAEISNRFIGAADIGNISVVTLNGLAQWGAMRFVPPGLPNMPPVANAGSDQTVMLLIGAPTVTVMLDGRGSSDPDGMVQTYQWSGMPSPAPADSPMPTVTLGVGTSVFTLVVMDDDGASSAPDTVTITVPGISLAAPRDGDRVSGNAVAVAAAIGSMVNVTSILFQFRPAGAGAPFLDIATDPTTPFAVPWNTTPWRMEPTNSVL